ncbi:hypothetical protein FCS82_06500 [Oenococcus sp. UCMA 14587]|nr:hypothetical protein [Oenococcus sp. UCMA 14587]
MSTKGREDSSKNKKNGTSEKAEKKDIFNKIDKNQSELEKVIVEGNDIIKNAKEDVKEEIDKDAKKNSNKKETH